MVVFCYTIYEKIRALKNLNFMPEAQEKKTHYLKIFFIIVGAIITAFILLVVSLYIYLSVAKPAGIEINPFNKSVSNFDHPLLNPEQEKALSSLGIKTETIPATITPAQEQCAVNALGEERVNEIKSGAAPGIGDYLKAKDCF